MFIPRKLTGRIREMSRSFPVVALTGPRQSGKTTLLKHLFPNRSYVSLEDLDARRFAKEDPRGFIDTYRDGAIFDEVQRAPELFSYLQGVVDSDKKPGQFILSGSQNFLLIDAISQTLAGRVALLTLLPLSLEEIGARAPLEKTYAPYLFRGFYPRLYEARVDPRDWYANYTQTYLERDVRTIKQITDFSAFQTFVRLCAGRVGQLLNLSSLAHDCGITHNTARSWLSVLEASFVAFLLLPHHENFNKRLTKSPKLYFFDPGLAASLLGITNASQIATHHLRGALFESFIISEFMKYAYNRGERPGFFFWRDKSGNEIDCIIDTGRRRTPVEIKAGTTVAADYFSSLAYWNAISGNSADNSFVVYGGGENQKRSAARVVSWRSATSIFHRE